MNVGQTGDDVWRSNVQEGRISLSTIEIFNLRVPAIFVTFLKFQLQKRINFKCQNTLLQPNNVQTSITRSYQDAKKLEKMEQTTVIQRNVFQRFDFFRRFQYISCFCIFSDSRKHFRTLLLQCLQNTLAACIMKIYFSKQEMKFQRFPHTKVVYAQAF